MRWSHPGNLKRNDGAVGDAPHPDVAVAPRLRRGPFDHVVTILSLGVAVKTVVPAGGIAGAAHIEVHRGVAVFDNRMMPTQRAFAVGCVLEDGREFTGRIRSANM